MPFYLVMEYVEGMTVEELLRQEGGQLELRRTLKIALGVAEALTFAHRPPCVNALIGWCWACCTVTPTGVCLSVPRR